MGFDGSQRALSAQLWEIMRCGGRNTTADPRPAALARALGALRIRSWDARGQAHELSGPAVSGSAPQFSPELRFEAGGTSLGSVGPGSPGMVWVPRSQPDTSTSAQRREQNGR